MLFVRAFRNNYNAPAEVPCEDNLSRSYVVLLSQFDNGGIGADSGISSGGISRQNDSFRITVCFQFWLREIRVESTVYESQYFNSVM